MCACVCERACVCVCVCVCVWHFSAVCVQCSVGATPTEIRHTMGFENMQARAERVESSIKEAEEIYEAIDALAQAKDKALLYSLGIQCSSSSGRSRNCT